MRNRIVFLSVSMGFILSPHSLIVSGNVAGLLGPTFLIAFGVAAACDVLLSYIWDGCFGQKKLSQGCLKGRHVAGRRKHVSFI